MLVHSFLDLAAATARSKAACRRQVANGVNELDVELDTSLPSLPSLSLSLPNSFPPFGFPSLSLSQLVQGSPIPQDRNKSSRPMGTFQEVSKRDIQIEIPMANVQLLVPQTVVVENLKDVGLWTQEREDALPAQ